MRVFWLLYGLWHLKGQPLGPTNLGWAFKIRVENKEDFTI